jgi:hypothetical protein
MLCLLFHLADIRTQTGGAEGQTRGGYLDVTGWRKLYDEELHHVCPSPNVVRVIKCKGACNTQRKSEKMHSEF